MIKVKLGAIVEAEEPIAKLDKLSNEGLLSFKASYKLSRIIKKIQPELQDYYAEKKKILEKFGEEIIGEDKQPTGQFKVNDSENFLKYMNELLSVDVELSNIFPIEMSDIEDVKGFSIQEVMRLGEFITGLKDIETEPTRKRISIKFDEPEPQVENEVAAEVAAN